MVSHRTIEPLPQSDDRFRGPSRSAAATPAIFSAESPNRFRNRNTTALTRGRARRHGYKPLSCYRESQTSTAELAERGDSSDAELWRGGTHTFQHIAIVSTTIVISFFPRAGTRVPGTWYTVRYQVPR